ncbi:unnamed protein product [Calicophoron daubneyi]|uniref:Uncharacterized protein n=1 Tax=Calicophoron daubneyi TaxID=300641 RepID=A0AAV2T1J4_CALDB
MPSSKIPVTPEPATRRILAKPSNSFTRCVPPIQSTSEDSIQISLLQINKAILDLTLECRPAFTLLRKMAPLMTGVHEFCQEFRQMPDRLIAGSSVVGEALATCLNVPAHTMEQVMALESSLSDPAYYRQLSDFCLQVAGVDLRAIVRNLLSRLISPAMTEDIHCIGKCRKFVFRNSMIYCFVLGKFMHLF